MCVGKRSQFFVEITLEVQWHFFSISNRLTCCRDNILLIVIRIENNCKKKKKVTKLHHFENQHVPLVTVGISFSRNCSTEMADCLLTSFDR